jgi:hypothetical protein
MTLPWQRRIKAALNGLAKSTQDENKPTDWTTARRSGRSQFFGASVAYRRDSAVNARQELLAKEGKR